MERDCGLGNWSWRSRDSLLWTVFSGEGLWLTVGSFQWWGTVAYCGQFLVVRDCGLLWTVFSGEGLCAWETGPEGLGTAYCGQFLVVRDCGLRNWSWRSRNSFLWTGFSSEGLWPEVLSPEELGTAYCGQFLVVRDCRLKNWPWMSRNSRNSLLWTVFSGEGLCDWKTGPECLGTAGTAYCGQLLVVRDCRLRNWPWMSRNSRNSLLWTVFSGEGL